MAMTERRLMYGMSGVLCAGVGTHFMHVFSQAAADAAGALPVAGNLSAYFIGAAFCCGGLCGLIDSVTKPKIG